MHSKFTRTIKKYDKQFKMDVVNLFLNGKDRNEIFRDLEVPHSTLSGWVRQFTKKGEKSFTGSGKISPENEEKYQLKKEIEDLKLQRDILKKALAIFSKQQL